MSCELKGLFRLLRTHSRSDAGVERTACGLLGLGRNESIRVEGLEVPSSRQANESAIMV